jgi:hypothetical protein
MIWKEEEVVREANRTMEATVRRAGLADDFGPFTSWRVG